MRILRFFLLVASVVGVVYIFHALNIGNHRYGTVDSLAVWAGTGLKYHFSSFLRSDRDRNSRLTYLLRLWYDAKMRELRERVGGPPRLDREVGLRDRLKL